MKTDEWYQWRFLLPFEHAHAHKRKRNKISTNLHTQFLFSFDLNIIN